MSNASAGQRWSRALMNNFGTPPIELVGGHGAVVVDAVRTGAPPGTLLVSPAAAMPEVTDAAASTHGLGVRDTLALARALGRLPARAYVVGVEAEQTRLGEGLSAPVRAAVPLAASAVLELVAQLDANEGC